MTAMFMKLLPWIALAALAIPGALAFKLGGKDDAMFTSPIPEQFLQKPLPEKGGVVSWRTLGQVMPVRLKDRFVPQFSNEVLALDNREVRIQGFMLPLSVGDQQKAFLLTAMAPACPFCLPGGPDSMVEVQARTPVRYTIEPIMLSGRLRVLRDDPAGLYYRLLDARLVN